MKPRPSPSTFPRLPPFAVDGTIPFRPDVYERDGAVRAALEEPPPQPAATSEPPAVPESDR